MTPRHGNRSRCRLAVVMGGHWSAAKGGAQYQAQCIVDEVVRRGDTDVYYVAHVVDPRYKAVGYEIQKIGAGAELGYLEFLPDLRPLYNRLVELRPTVIYQRGLKAYTGVCALYARRHGARFVFHAAHDNDVRRAKQRLSRKLPIHWLDRRISEYGLHRADVIVAQTKDQARMLEEEYGLNATMVVHNFHPVPARPSDRNDDLQRKLRVIWVANFKGWKHPEVFVSLAEANKQNDDVEFVMIGMPGHDRHFAALHERIARLENLRYLGELSIEAVDDQIAASDIFVNTSDAEGFPNTFVQAWMCGVPVVSCHVDPDQCLSKHGAGILTGGSAGLAPAIESLRRDRERLRALSRAALAYGSANHGVEHAAPLIDLLTSSGGVARDAPAHDS